MRDVDLAIIGGGFAGMACAAAAGARGVRTLVVDRKPTAGAKVHTTGILVKEVADEWDVPRHLTRKVTGVRLYAPGGRHFDLQSPGYYFLATDTPGVLQWLSRRATVRGASVRFGTHVEGFEFTGERVAVRGTDVRAKWVIGADGARSFTARRAGLGQNQRLLVGAEVELQGVRGMDEDRLHVFVDSKLAPGYIAWAVPGVGMTQVGLACRADRRADIDALLARLSKVFNLDSAVEVGRRRGVIPVGGPVWPMSKRVGRAGVMLIGDAAGLVSPLTAGGIQTALHYGRLAGVAVADHLLDGAADPAKVVARAQPRFVLKGLMRTAIDFDPPNAFYDVALRIAPLRAVAQAVFYHQRGLMSRAAWRDMAAGCVGITPGRATN